MKKLLAALLSAVFILGLCVMPRETRATKTAPWTFTGEAGKSYQDVLNTLNANLGDPEVSVKINSGANCVKDVSAGVQKSSVLSLLLNYACVEAGTVKLTYSFSYTYSGQSFSNDWDVTITVTGDNNGGENGGSGSGENSGSGSGENSGSEEPSSKQLPAVTKHPSGEKVEEGGTCSFIARADHSDGITWYFTKGSETVKASDAADRFPGLKLSGLLDEKLKLSNIPASLNGWKVHAEFENENGTVSSKKASIKIKEEEEPGAPVLTAGSSFALGVDCSVNGASLCAVKSNTQLHCVANEIDGMAFDHWEINGAENDALQGPDVTFKTSETVIVRAVYHARRVIRTVGAHMRFMDAKGNPAGEPFTEFDFEEDYKNPATGKLEEGGTISVFVQADVPAGKKINCWNLNGAPFYFPGEISSFDVLELTGPVSYEVIFS